jgi:hypothetical protein
METIPGISLQALSGVAARIVSAMRARASIGHPARLLRAAVAAPTVALVLASIAAALAAPAGSSAEGAPQVRIAGSPQTVFNWARQACAPTQVPDLPVRVFRDYRGRIQLLLSDYVNFRMIGPSLARLHPDCHAVLRSPENASPQSFEDREWLASIYTTDGRNVWALVHEEYQGNRHPGRCPEHSYFPCWYNAVTLAHSTDGGRSYSHQLTPRQLIATPSRPYEAGVGPSGVFSPSNIVTGSDGAHYALVRVRVPGATRGVCLLRTTRVGSPRAWRAWNGSGFGGGFSDPYRSPPSAGTACTLLDPGLIAEMTESLTYNRALGRYLLVGLAPPGPLSIGPKVTGIYYSTSRDLITWTPRTLIAPAVSVSSYLCGGPAPIAYPSVVDPRSSSRTYATSGRRPYLYFTQFHYTNCHQTPDRDLMRVPLEISP